MWETGPTCFLMPFFGENVGFHAIINFDRNLDGKRCMILGENWWNIGLPPVIFQFWLGFSMKSTIQRCWGVPPWLWKPPNDDWPVKCRVPYLPEAGVADEICDDLLGAWGAEGPDFPQISQGWRPLKSAGNLMWTMYGVSGLWPIAIWWNFGMVCHEDPSCQSSYHTWSFLTWTKGASCKSWQSPYRKLC